MTTYTLISPAGDIIARGLSLEDAARRILTYDGREFEVRPAPGGCSELWARDAARAGHWTRTVVFSLHRGELGERGIFRSVVAADWPGHPSAITDAQADRLVEALDEEEG